MAAPKKTSLTADDISPPTDDCHHSHNVPSVVKEKSKEPLWSEFLTIPSPAYKKQTHFLDKHGFLPVLLFKEYRGERKEENEAAEKKKDVRENVRRKEHLKKRKKSRRGRKRNRREVLQNRHKVKYKIQANGSKNL